MALTGLKKFKLGTVLGSGAFATVTVATDMNTDTKYAMKIIDKVKCKGQEKQIIKEVAILKKIVHSNIVRLFDVFETKEKIYLQMEIVRGGELFDKIVAKGFLTENHAKRILVDILSAIKCIHDMNIVHRDLKPENLLLSDTTDDASIKIADFGLSTVVSKNSLLETSCGTLTYVAPEVLKGKGYEGKSADMWSIGVITYILLSGYPPFHAESDAKILELTLSGKYQYFSPEWDVVSQEAKNFIDNLIRIQSNSRMTVDEALNHKWLLSEIRRRKGEAMNEETVDSVLHNVAANLSKNFNARKKMKSLIDAVAFMTKLQIMEGIRLDSRSNSASNSRKGSLAPSPSDNIQEPTKEQKMKEIQAVKARLEKLELQSQ